MTLGETSRKKLRLVEREWNLGEHKKQFAPTDWDHEWAS
jgi:hypothetical protein